MARSSRSEREHPPARANAGPRRPPNQTSGSQKARTGYTADNLRILTYVEPSDIGVSDEDQFPSSDQKSSLWQRVRGIVPKIDTVSSETLRSNLTRFLQAMEKSLSDAPTQLADYRLDEIEVAVEVSAEGEISLLGNGAKVGGKGTLTLKLKHS